MLTRTNLDMDVLRTFVTGFELGSFAKAAERLGRSQSAISTQLRKLEDQVGQVLVQKAGRGLSLTTAGESLHSYAKRILELNDEAVDSLRSSDVEGWVRLGLPQDFAESWLPAVLGRFARANPKVRVEVRAERNANLLERTLTGELDLALGWGGSGKTPHATTLADLSIAWIGRPGWGNVGALGAEPLPLVAFELPCVFRAAGVAALDQAGIPWRLVFTSPSLAGLWAATEAGLGITIRTAISLPKTLSILDPATTGLPALPTIPLVLYAAEADPPPAVSHLAQILRETVIERTAAFDVASVDVAA
ncbi:MAG TPA: LysR substrate-binding domain-containing protein [Aliidongia sp.]|uniref:LysR substrate-binding domain-containing protein n=1 Tax=Aliidongia sp. TaxID=1914230 RepID=UPI002DDD6710|nr:LysR substrate-binding domain-containing protein [Aliidongia sp.]HEV2673425.1 LysR substrate-binding domain-containing protein [Aliidongia sp.]